MRPGKRFGLSAVEKSEVWRRWKAGQSQHEIGRAFGKEHSCIRSVLLPRGGIRPAARRRSRLALNLTEREDISRGIASDLSIREIARGMNRAASTVSREIIRHGGRPTYRAQDADRQAWVSALRPKRCLLATNRKLRDMASLEHRELLSQCEIFQQETTTGTKQTCNRPNAKPNRREHQSDITQIERMRPGLNLLILKPRSILARHICSIT